ncbi:porin [Pseudomaricurvus alkylphenolicus]|uniref:porin n=1 Tax=Pseudomaricurvus alkylphenolicus TaxID=1306991 RepID=UPI00141EC631|nr:porin [Pseudomaricurvus alkylphenolicus]NIB42748.1 porin [Pseudomaricurvus alkylphenolicus]
MKRPLTVKGLLLCVLPFLYGPPAFAELGGDVSGFARLVGGLHDESDVSYQGYEDSWRFDQDTLLGLQGRLDISDKFSATALLVGRTDSDLDSGIEWLYASYRPNDSFNIKLGQMQTPFYSLSDSLDVGYSYPWVIAPSEVYNEFVFNKFQGIDVRYSHTTEDYSAHIEAYYGEFDDDITVNGSSVGTEVEDLTGIIAELRIENLSFRASYHTGDIFLDLPELNRFADLLANSGFPRSAATLTTEAVADFYQFSTDYDSLSYFLKGEWIKIANDTDYFAEIQSYYLTYGRYYDKWTFLITYGNRRDTLPRPVSGEIPLGFAPQLQQLALGYQQLFASRVEDDIDSYGLGVRWDFRSDMALKAEYKWLESEHRRSATLYSSDSRSFDGDAKFFSVALEWVF